MHSNHKILELSDIESLKKENITINSSLNEFNETTKKIILLKDLIEKEINKINELYEKTNDDLTKSFQIKHEKLLKEENDIREKLQNEVTKIKEKLENYLSESNNEIKINERINKGIQKIEKEENMIKNLTYISKINKSMKEMKKLLQELMKSLNFFYEEEQSNIKYEEYYFNGIPIPYNIEFKDITGDSVNIYWKIDINKNINIDKNIFKYIIEMRKENENFSKVYEGNNTNCSINNLELNTNYEFRICSYYNDSIGPWTEIHKIKTLNIDSLLLKESKREIEFIQKLKEWIGFKKIELIYRGTRDGMTGKAFHNKCNNQGETITLIKNDKGNIFGGYASISWTSDNSYHSAPESFIFTLTNIHNTEPTKFPSKNDNYEVAHSSNCGPRFGGGNDIHLDSDFKGKKGQSYFPCTYPDILGKGKSIFTGDSNNVYFSISEIEVFKIFK